MIISRGVFLFLCLACVSRSEKIKLEAKKLLRGKVIANGYSVVAKSLRQCIEHCNKREDTCDGIVFHEIIGKCRLINKCAPTFQVDNSSSAVYYSKRPQIKTQGFVHDSGTDSCLGLIPSRANYPSAEALCAKQNANPATLNEKHLNDLGRDLVLNSTAEWAWIKEDNVANKDKTKPHGISGNDVLSEEVFSPEVVQWRNDSKRNCWGLNKHGQWGQFSCKNVTMFVLCQVSRFTGHRPKFGRTCHYKVFY